MWVCGSSTNYNQRNAILGLSDFIIRLEALFWQGYDDDELVKKQPPVQCPLLYSYHFVMSTQLFISIYVLFFWFIRISLYVPYKWIHSDICWNFYLLSRKMNWDIIQAQCKPIIILRVNSQQLTISRVFKTLTSAEIIITPTHGSAPLDPDHYRVQLFAWASRRWEKAI